MTLSILPIPELNPYDYLERMATLDETLQVQVLNLLIYGETLPEKEALPELLGPTIETLASKGLASLTLSLFGSLYYGLPMTPNMDLPSPCPAWMNRATQVQSAWACLHHQNPVEWINWCNENASWKKWMTQQWLHSKHHDSKDLLFLNEMVNHKFPMWTNYVDVAGKWCPDLLPKIDMLKTLDLSANEMRDQIVLAVRQQQLNQPLIDCSPTGVDFS